MNKRQNHQLNNWVLFLTQYLSCMKIIHWAKKLHRNIDMLFRLFCENKNKKNINAYLITTLQLSEKFTTCIVNMLLNDSHFHAIYNKIQRQITLTVNNSDSSQYSYHCFFWDSQQHILIFDKNWLCIFKALQKNILFNVHNDHIHQRIDCIYKLLQNTIFISKMRDIIMKYINFCLICSIVWSWNHRSYDLLQSIQTSM